MESAMRVGEVFVPGGMPTVTYNSRAHLNLEEQVEDYLDDGHRILSVSGPTKTGKTVLIKRLASRALWISGGDISSLDSFLQYIADDLEVPASRERSSGDEEASEKTVAGRAGAGSWIGGERKTGKIEKVTRGSKDSLAVSIRSAVKKELRSSSQPIVIDDFHYVPQAVQEEVVRYLKSLIFDGLRVIVIAVPHRAYDVVRVEKEMTGRVKKMEVGFWEPHELAQIASSGFSALNLDDPSSLHQKLVEECFSSPHLMQDFSLKLCRTNGIRRRPLSNTPLSAPPDGWGDFFGKLAADSSKTAFDMLVRGPRQRKDRITRTLTDGTTTDIYGLILAAIAHTGPKTSLTYEQLRTSIRDVATGTLPHHREVTRVLDKMSEIARKQIEGEPVLEYDHSLATLHIADPFFAFYLRWASPHRQGAPATLHGS